MVSGGLASDETLKVALRCARGYGFRVLVLKHERFGGFYKAYTLYRTLSAAFGWERSSILWSGWGLDYSARCSDLTRGAFL